MQTKTMRKKGKDRMREKLWKPTGRVLAVALLLLPATLVILPILLLLSGSLMDAWELGGYIGTVFTGGEEFISWKLLPDYPTFAGYKRLLFETPQFFVLFWHSMKLGGCILAG